ncbi:hypothetical protein FGL01_11440 [Flavobacterium glycines]|nr:lasso peptide biosynthesis B2 protein [Flavobacterium glycines]GEL10405.1 hypothetical protein FGL01_11440 [Flavobacterium glycines]
MVFWLAIYRNLLLAIKSRKAFTEQICKNQDTKVILTAEKTVIAKDIALAIYIVNKYILWKNVCRHQSWQAVYLLLQYQIPFDYFVGIEKNKYKKEGHSWVKVNGKFICGNCNEKNYFLV